jgi:hypothetical protein
MEDWGGFAVTDTPELRRLLAEATPGDWKQAKCPCGHPSCSHHILHNQGSVGFRAEDAALIVAMKNALPGLLDEVEQNQWRDIESAPKDGTEVVVLIGAKDVRLGWFFAPSSTTRAWLDQRGDVIKPTHWLPLPTPPANLGGRDDG